jgi:hypothetical protein
VKQNLHSKILLPQRHSLRHRGSLRPIIGPTG